MSLAIHQQKFRSFYIPVLVGLLILIADLLVTIVVKDYRLRVGFIDILTVVVNVLATAALFWAVYETRGKPKRLKIAWLLIAFAQLFYVVADLIWAILEIGSWIIPFPSIADFFYLTFYPLFFTGTVLLSLENRVPLQRIKNTLDMAIIMASATLFFWALLLHPMLVSNIYEPWHLQALTLAYPVGDLLMLSAVLWLLNSNPNRYARPSIIMLTLSSSVMIFADTLFSYQTLSGTYQTGGILDIGWPVSYVLIGFAALHQVYRARNQKVKGEPEANDLTKETLRKRILSLLPYVWMALSYLILYQAIKSGEVEYLYNLYIWVGIIIGMVILRQFWAFLEIRKLNDKLLHALSQVQHQTQVLENINQELETEIQHRVRVEEQLSFDALHDSLTNLPNRTLFFQRLESSLDDCRKHTEIQYSVLFMDIDQFKVINDSLGHGLGDQLLVIIAQRLVKCLRGADTVARLGGDEFVFLLENTGGENAIDFIVNRINEEIQKAIMLEDHQVFVTTSIGVVLDVKGYSTPGNVLRDADLAMYRAKALGKNRYEIYHEGMHHQAISRLEIEENLRDAIDNRELELYYQPIFNLWTGEIAGFEALIRWNHPRFGILLPNEFLGIANETGLIHSITRQSLFDVCCQISNWKNTCPDFEKYYISINLSAKQIFHEDLIPQLKKALNQTGVSPSSIHFEITENTLIECNDKILKIFEQLRRLGIHLAIDDFGTGYSSLAYLQNFPIQAVKIDQSFIREIGVKKNALDLIKAMISLGENLGVEIIAEGIETLSQMEELKKMSCRYGQGFLLSLPLTRDSVDDLLRDNKARISPK